MTPTRIMLFVAWLLATLSTGPVTAGESITSVGGDTYLVGSSPKLGTPAPRDVFIAGFSSESSTSIAGSLHLAGFRIDANATTGGDLYAAGADITVSADIKGNATVAGFSVQLAPDAVVGGNMRLAAGTATINSRIDGSLVATAGELHINAPIAGDVRFSAMQISFGPNARIGGRLDYITPTEAPIPVAVIAADRVHYSAPKAGGIGEDLGQTLDESTAHFWPSAVTIAVSALMTVAFLVLVAALFMAFAPEQVARLRGFAQHHVGKTLLMGVLGLATLTGLVPVSAMTLVGIPMIPFVIFAIIVVWTLGYLLGVYALAMRVSDAFHDEPTTLAGKLTVLAAGLIIAALLNFIPIAGWMINLAIVLLGFGASTASLLAGFTWYRDYPAPRLEGPPQQRG